MVDKLVDGFVDGELAVSVLFVGTLGTYEFRLSGKKRLMRLMVDSGKVDSLSGRHAREAKSAASSPFFF